MYLEAQRARNITLPYLNIVSYVIKIYTYITFKE